VRLTLRKSVSVLAALVAGTGSALVAPALAGAIAGPELKLAAADDTYVSSGRRTTTFGAEDKLVTGRLGTDVKTSFLKFTVPAGTDVTGARLSLTTVGDVAGKISVRRVVTNAWTEKQLTSATAPALGLVVASASPKANDTEVALDLGAEVTGPGTYSFAVQSSAARTTRFRSAENKTGVPMLTVSTAAQPVPATEPAQEPAVEVPPADNVPAPAETTVAPEPTATTAPGECATDAKLVPSCGVLWGGAAGGFTDAPRDQALKDWEKTSGRTATIFHTYHKGDEPFPTKAEIAMTRDPAKPRVLLLNWKIAYGSTWAKVAKGEQDKRIDAFAARVKSTYPEKFFLVLNHEPENDVIAKAGSGWEAKDFAAMYRHTILRLRAKGVTNAINVMAYMGNEKWMSQSWWKDIYPGDDVVDWMGLDSYVSAEKGYYHYGFFADLLDRKGSTGPAFYAWAVTKKKPLMIAEWGAYHRIGKPVDKAPQYNSVRPELAKRPAIKAIVHFDTKADDEGDRDISIDSTKTSLAAFQKLAADPIFNVKLTLK
jgi:beta-mannanase